MNIIEKIFGFIAKKDSVQVYNEKDNIGTRILTADRNQAAYSVWAMKGMIPHGNIYYGFKSKEEAYLAMLDIPCIKLASDSKELICTEIIEFGVYWDSYNDKYWEAFLQGPALTPDIYLAAEKSFIRHNGIKICSKEPVGDNSKPKTVLKKPQPNMSNSVKFIKKSNVSMMGITGTKEIYEAPNKSVAIEFLKSKQVSKQYYYIEIETPDGLFGKDIDGGYEG
jgi:hypothetical protein